MMAAMRLVETHEVADAAIMKSSRKLFGASPLRNVPRPDLVTPLERHDLARERNASKRATSSLYRGFGRTVTLCF